MRLANAPFLRELFDSCSASAGPFQYLNLCQPTSPSPNFKSFPGISTPRLSCQTHIMDIDDDGVMVFPFHNIDPQLLDQPPFPQRFHIFSNLPIELRVKIWIFAHPGPRSVFVTLGNRSPGSHQLPRTPPPLWPRRDLAHLFINHESRGIFLEHYTCIFTHADNHKPRGRGAGSYFNYKKDSLCVTSGLRGLRYLLQVFPQDMIKVQYLDINTDTHAIISANSFSWGEYTLKLSDLPDLKLVTLRRMTNCLGQSLSYSMAFNGDFADTLEVLQKVLRHPHDWKHCEKEKFVRLAVQCVYSDPRPQFRDLFTILWPLGKDVVKRWEGMDDMYVEQSGGVVSTRRRWRCRSGEIELHQDWERINTRRPF
jgi:hypothetical protein